MQLLDMIGVPKVIRTPVIAVKGRVASGHKKITPRIRNGQAASGER